MDSMLNGLKIKNYRGISKDWVEMPDFRRVNFFIGSNNSGKSSILSFISLVLTKYKLKNKFSSEVFDNILNKYDLNNYSEGSPSEFALSTPTNLIVDRILGGDESYFQIKEKLKSFIKLCEYREGFIWVYYKIDGPYVKRVKIENLDIAIENAVKHDVIDIVKMTSKLSSANSYDLFKKELKVIVDLREYINIPSIYFVPAMRKVGDSGSDFSDFSGKGVISLLERMSNPDLGEEDNYKKFQFVNDLLKEVTGQPDAQLRIPHNRKHILVKMNDRELPLNSLGTGIEELIILAVACTYYEETIICIEEPEIHLHPLLQKKLMQFLSKKTNNQYFIATHSASFIDTPESSVFHVWLENNTTHIRESILNTDKFNICRDLGYKASDILQSNCVIWVEGPSERIYLNFWLKGKDPDLKEGIDYTIMFYGGRLLSHLSGVDEDEDENEVKEFIQLPRINRNSIIIMDSDKENEKDEINDTKKRIGEEFSQHGISWVTDGREIENYVNSQYIQDAIKKIHSKSYSSPCQLGKFDHCFYYKKQDGETSTSANKVSIAKWVVENTRPEYEILDLDHRISEIINFIHHANGSEKGSVAPVAP